MAYWWVNHKQTFSSEIEGGYIWSPMKNSNNSKNQTYLNLTLTNPGDIVLSYASAKIKAIGIVSSNCREQAKPSEFGKAGVIWSNSGWAVPIDWEILVEPITPKDHIEEISKLLPKINSPLQPNGNGNQGCYLAAIQNDLGLLLVNLAKPQNIDAITSIEANKREIEVLAAVAAINGALIEPTEKDQLIKARQGQGKFRRNVESIESKCRVTGVEMKNLLIASHIKPWRLSDNSERLDGNNGLLLSPHIDRLFDRGWITFLANGDLIYAGDEIRSVLKDWHVKTPVNVGKFNEQQCHFMAFHRSEIYKGKQVIQGETFLV